MTALSQERVSTTRAMKRILLTLAAGQSVYAGAQVGFSLGVGTLVNVTATGAGIFPCGTASETVDATSVAKTLQVDFEFERYFRWYANHTSGTLDATYLGTFCFFQDNQTVTTLQAGRAIAGRVWAVDATKGVLVEEVRRSNAPLFGGTLPAPVSADVIVTASAIEHGGVYLLPALAANSTVTLPVTGVLDGTQITVVADGTQGAYTTTYRYGTTTIATALVATKAHSVFLTKMGTIWSLVPGTNA